MLQSFVPLFAMTFFICLFIVLMQFLWRYIDDLVGKGLGMDVIAELFFYAALTMIPMALPLAILLASLMTFGNLGERFELTAMKASGVSLVKSMRPLMVLMGIIAVAAFFFQNDVLPVAQTKMYTLLFSMRQKSPELEIPEGVFYDQIPGYNIFVKEKNRDSGTLHHIMIYDMSKGFDNASLILADSGRLAMTEDKTHLLLRLWQGESFENLSEAGGNMSNVPYRRESFDDKEIVLKFDANFNRMDEEGMRNQYVGKNISQLKATIDSVNQRVDSIGGNYAAMLMEQPMVGVQYYESRMNENKELVRTVNPAVAMTHPVNVDSVFHGTTSGYRLNYLNGALAKARRQKQDYEFKGLTLTDQRKVVRRHGMEMHKKFTLSFACIIFFFIGAPLGAIIRKGGLGMPLVISVFLFIFYYIIDNTGFKLARDGRWEVWSGMWLSSAILLPLGVFFTYKAVNDSAVFNPDAYMNFFRKLLGRNEARLVTMKEIVMDEVVKADALRMLAELSAKCRKMLAECPPKQSYTAYWLKGYDRGALRSLSVEEEKVVEYLSNSRDKMVILKLMDFPILRSLWLYHPTGLKWVGWAAIVVFPVGVPLWLAGRSVQSHLRKEIEMIIKVAGETSALIDKM
ncbi:MAG: YjgP/YjgQ family permease [Barnesiella sp.]|nr:YjgP/YjgQ family permease [Barnesiella sp.]MBD5374407.1 YjgP/YjgQ family permease [Bacteroides sp.]